MKNLRLTVVVILVGAFVLAPVVARAQSDEEWSVVIDLCNKGDEESGENNYEKAIEYYTKAISIAPTFSRPYYNRGRAYNKLKKYNEAIEDFNKNISIDPCEYYVTHIRNVHYERGIAYHGLKKYDKAIEYFTEAIKIDDFNKAYYNRGLSYNAMGKTAKAQADFKKACDGGIEEACVELKK